MTMRRIELSGLFSRILFWKDTCQTCVSLRFKSTKQRIEITDEKKNTVAHQKSAHSPPYRKQYSDIDFIFNYPLVKSNNEIDSYTLKESAGNFQPPVTTIINETMSDMSRFYLERWKKQMISQLGLEGFQKQQQETFANGSNLHTIIQQYLSGESESKLNIYETNVGHWKSLHKVLDEIQDTIAMEELVSHKDLYYRGKFDCLAMYRDKLCLIDWKTSKKAKPTIKDTFDNPLQVAAYIGAINNSQFGSDKGLDPITCGAIVVAYPDGSPADVHIMDQKMCEENWKLWLERLHKFWTQVRNISKAE